MTVIYKRDGFGRAAATPIADRFWGRVAVSPDCWEWQGARNSNGYGIITSGPRGRARQQLTHRASWELVNGSIPDGMRILHTCDNPPCVRPDHLFLGTQTDNMRDCAAKGRINHHGRLTPEQVRAIRSADGSGRAIGRAFGITQTMVSRIKRGKAWTTVV